MTKIIEEFYQKYPEYRDPEYFGEKDHHYDVIGLSPISVTLYKLYIIDLSGAKIDITTKSFPYKDLRKLLQLNYIYGDDQGYMVITDQGYEYINACISYPEYCPTSTGKWMLEAKTKTRLDGKESEFKNIAIPKQSSVEPFVEFDDSGVELRKFISKLAKQLEIPEHDVINYIANEQVKKCTSCMRISIFHINKSRPDGLQSRCINCNKK